MKFKPHRNHPLWYAYWTHRISGLGLVLFLPLHLFVLSLALNHKAQLDELLVWTEQPWVKAVEFGLVFLLSVHLFGGLRLMALEWLTWKDQQKTYAALAVSFSFLIAGLFFMRAI